VFAVDMGEQTSIARIVEASRNVEGGDVMAVKIRLARVGRRKGPAYRVVVADSRKARDGRFIEILGIYQPLKEQTRVEVDAEKALQWLKNGAIPSETVRSIFRKLGILKRFHESRKPVARPASA
jgi:small subunit ribosomal protein S16